VKFESTIEKTASGTGRTIFFQTLASGFLDLWMHSQAKIIVGTDHDQLAAIKDSLGSLEPIKRLEIRIYPFFHGLPVEIEIKALLKNVHRDLHCARRYFLQRSLPDDNLPPERTGCISSLSRFFIVMVRENGINELSSHRDVDYCARRYVV